MFGLRADSWEMVRGGAMTACDAQDYPYEPMAAMGLEGSWRIAMGLQTVDGLEPSAYLRSLAAETVEGGLSLDAAGKALQDYYRELDESAAPVDEGEREADFVSQRITELLVRRPFVMAPSMLSYIHRYLFQDLDQAVYIPGKYKDSQLVKRESILNGDSVLYGAPEFIDNAPAMFFAAEAGHAYGTSMSGVELDNLAAFIAHIWQVHPFVEGNTRTIAVFTELYLDHLGFDARNEPFADNARYFRNALVRANYRNARAGIAPDSSYLVRFLDNAVNGASHELHSRDLMCEALFADPSLIRNMPSSAAIEK